MESTKRLVDDMSAFKVSRWMALINGVNVIAKNAEKYGKSPNFMNIKNTPLNSYVDEEGSIIYNKITGKETKVEQRN